jgi:ABC-type transport system substrate-binding protein
VTFHFDAPDSAFVPSITYTPASIVPEAVVKRLGQKKFNWAPIGTGPFKVTSVDQQHGVKMSKNTHYWQPGLPKANGVDWQFHIDPQLSALRILKGEQDMMYEPAPAGAINQVRNNPAQKKQLVVTQLNELWWLSLSEKVPELAKLPVRKAIAMAIDKTRLQRVLKGVGTPATGGIFSPLSPYSQPGLGYTYDPAGAKKLLASAGLAKGFSVKAWCANFFPWTDMAQAVQQDLSAIGIKMNLTPMSYDQFVNLTNGAPAGLVFFNWGLSYPHGSFIIDAAFTKAAIKAGCCNYADWSYPGFDALAQEAHRTPSTAKSISLYKKMDHIVTKQQAVWVPLMYGARPDLISARVKGFVSGRGGTDEPKELWSVSV